MHFQAASLVLLGLVSSAAALPAGGTHNLKKRDVNGVFDEYTCDGSLSAARHSAADQDLIVNRAAIRSAFADLRGPSNAQTHTWFQNQNRPYPHNYGVHENILVDNVGDCQLGKLDNWREYPVRDFTTGGNENLHRSVYEPCQHPFTAEVSFNFCGVITHYRNAGQNSFVKCEPAGNKATVNLGGSGGLIITKKTKGKKGRGKKKNFFEDDEDNENAGGSGVSGSDGMSGGITAN